MKRSFVKFIALAMIMACGVAFAGAPANMKVTNTTGLFANAYLHKVATPYPVAPHGFLQIPWGSVINVCHNTPPPMASSGDPCAFEVYATDDPSNARKIDVATVTFYLSDGHVLNVHNKAQSYGVKFLALAPGEFELVSG